MARPAIDTHDEEIVGRLQQAATIRTLPAQIRKELTLAANEILMLRQRAETALSQYSDAVEYIEELERKTRPRGRHALKWGSDAV